MKLKAAALALTAAITSSSLAMAALKVHVAVPIEIAGVAAISGGSEPYIYAVKEAAKPGKKLRSWPAYQIVNPPEDDTLTRC